MVCKTLLLHSGTRRSSTYQFESMDVSDICSDFLKERLFGLSNPQGNHGESIKEAHFHLDNTPTVSPHYTEKLAYVMSDEHH